MDETRTFEAEDTLGTLLDRVERGEEIVITRRGTPVARLVPEPAPRDRSKAIAAAQRMLDRSEQMSLGPDLSIKQLIEEGRQ